VLGGELAERRDPPAIAVSVAGDEDAVHRRKVGDSDITQSEWTTWVRRSRARAPYHKFVIRPSRSCDSCRGKPRSGGAERRFGDENDPARAGSRAHLKLPRVAATSEL
jgi:hypothetical protein